MSTIKHIIATIQHDGFLHPLGVEQGYIGNGLRETATNEYIKQTYGSLLLFLKDSAHAQEFKVTEDKHGKFYIDCTQRPKTRVFTPADFTPLDKDTTSIMYQNLQKWCFPSKNIHVKIHEKYKGQVGFPKDFIWKLERHKDTTVAVSMGVRAYRISKRVQKRDIHKFRGAVVSLEDGDVTRAISAQDLTKMGLHIDYAHSISLGYSKEKYYLILVVDGIDFVWGQTCTTRSTPEDLIQEFLTMTNLKVSSVRFDGAQEFGKSLSFKSFCHQEKIVMEPVAHYTHIQNARAENAIRVAKEHIHCLLRASNLPNIFWPYALMHSLRMRSYWPSDPHVTGLPGNGSTLSLQATRCGITLLPIFTSLGHTSLVIYLALTLL